MGAMGFTGGGEQAEEEGKVLVWKGAGAFEVGSCLWEEEVEGFEGLVCQTQAG